MKPFFPLRLAVVGAAVLASGAAVAQDFEPVPLKPHDPTWQPGYDTTLDCGPAPRTGPDPRALGLPAALAAAERNELTIGGLGITLAWAEREPDPAYVPALKRIVERFRCFDYDANMAFLAIEAAGEPSDYFVRYAEDWARDDNLADWAMSALAVRRDSSANAALRAVALAAPDRGRFGRVLQNAYGDYLQGLRMWAKVDSATVVDQLRLGSTASLRPLGGVVVRGVEGDSLSQIENLGNGAPSVILRRLLRDLGRHYPTATERALVAYEDTARARLAARDISPEHVPLFMDLVRRHGREYAFPSTGPPLPPVVERAAITPAVCTEVLGRGALHPARPSGALGARFTYVSGEPSSVRVPYGPGNALAGPWDPADPFAPVPPEVFAPESAPPTRSRTFRVVVPSGEAVVWTLLGQAVAAGEASPRCDGTDPLLLGALPASVVAWGASASFNGNAFAVSGAAHALDGTPADGPAVPSIVAPDAATLAAVLAALSARQRARLDGPAEARPLVISPASWAETLAARATITLGGRPGSVGTLEAPVVAYAPDGVRLDGRFEGVGVLVADGPVVLRGNARWTGLIVARDGLDVSGSAVVVGGATVGGALEIGGRARILYSPAALALAREAALAE